MNKEIKIWYWNGRPNAGDFFTHWLLTKMGFMCIFSYSPTLCVTGSILNNSFLTNAKIWGCGFHNIEEKKHFSKDQVFAVRGKLTEKNLGFTTTTGDPGILVSKFYKPNTIKKYKYGIIAHYVDYDFLKKIKLPSNATLIEIGTNKIEDLMNKINECEFILSSSLHGIIFAHSYGIPAMRIKYNELSTKNAFKFLDYYSNFNLKYIEKHIKNINDLNWNEFDILYENKELFRPSDDEILTNQNNLLKVFPIK